jgi:histidinol-phosphate aminotransferase
VDEAIHLICQTYLEARDEVLIVVPTFAMYEIFASATGARIIKIPAGKNFTFPTDDVVRHITTQTRLIAIANPNNPTGAAAPLKDLLLIASSAPNAAILIDEAYYEFHGDTLLRRWIDHPNLFVARTFSKAYGLAGLRAGLLMGCEDSMSAVRKVASPYSVNGVALACLPEAIGDLAYVEAYVQEVCESRNRLQTELKRLAIPFWPSRANFVLLKLGAANAAFIQAMGERGILVRDRSRDPGCRLRAHHARLHGTDQSTVAGAARDLVRDRRDSAGGANPEEGSHSPSDQRNRYTRFLEYRWIVAAITFQLASTSLTTCWNSLLITGVSTLSSRRWATLKSTSITL